MAGVALSQERKDTVLPAGRDRESETGRVGVCT